MAGTVTVVFIPQAWINDYAVEVDPQGPTEFQVPIADAQDANGEWLPDGDYESDRLRWHANAPMWMRDWMGPFTIQILHDELEEPA